MDIAIIGLSCKLPGADDQFEFWQNLISNKSMVSEIPATRWDWRQYWGDPKAEANKTNSKWGGFVRDADAFDHDFFGLIPKVVEAMDPQQRIMLELTWRCLEDAAVLPSDIRGRAVGLVFSAFNHDYKEMQEQGDDWVEAHHSTGNAAAIIANRVSHYFDLKGPSLSIDTACSGSLNAIHNAVQAIQHGDCEMAFAGGINLILTPTRHISFSKMGMMSPTGTCRTFDETANGYVRGEGAGVLLLKPLENALADGNSIYGVIKGTAVNHCGETYTLTYPSPDAQAQVIIQAHERAGVPINDVTYVEAHGTGTPKGDPIEIQGLCQAFGHLSDQQIIDLIDPEDFILPSGERLTLDTFIGEIRKAHEEGFFSFNSIADTFTHCFAAPVRDKQGICIATLCIVAPRADASAQYEHYRRVLIDCADSLARRVID